jgi:hypothetical protein
MFSNILSGAAGFPVADLGEEITHGLRFRNDPGVSAQYLYNTSLAGYQLSNYTISVWVKRGNFTDGSARYILTSGDTTTGTGGGNNPNKLSFNHDGSTPGFVFKDGGGDTHSSSQPLHRDYSAWYHLVAQRDQSAGTVKLYINGNEIGSASATGSPGLFNQSGDNAVLIGLYADPDYGSTGWNGHMAEFNFLESKLEPTDFGRTNEDGVWVPKSLSGLTSAQYGAKGFRLKFDSSAGLGDDSAPTGTGHSSANDFTAVGFDTAAVALYSPGLSANAGGTMNSLANAFDGSTGTAAYVSPTGIGMTFSPANDIAFTSLEIRPSNNNMSATFDGTTTNTPTGQYTQVATNGTINSTTPLTINVGAGLNCNLNAIRINGSTVLTDNTDNDVDYLDTPTSNYAVLSPNDYPLTNPTNANLSYRSSGSGAWQFKRASVAGQSSGKWYWEARAVGAGTSLMASIINENYSRNNYPDYYPGQGSGAGTGGWSLYGSNGTLYRNGVDQVASEGSAYSTDDILMFALDLDNGAWWVGQNGTWYQSATISEIEAGTTTNAIDTGTLTGRFWPGFVAQGGTSNGWDVNFGQMPFIYTQPSGFKAWQTNNFPEPTIKKGNKHFGILTYSAPGSPSYPITIDGSGGNNGTGELDFDGQPDLVWIKMRNGSENNIIFDTVRGTANSLRSDENIAENTTRTNFAFATNGFTFSAAQSEVYQQNDSYVAWCWKAGGTAVSNSDGSITSSVSANTDAGFSIVSYTGTATNATVGHGLNSTPDVVVVKNRDTANEWHVKHKDLSSNNNSVRFNSNAHQADFSVWQNTAPTSTVFSIGTQDGVNKSGADFIAYCWHSVPGFSKFGSYTGNGSSNNMGTFIDLGFKPALVWIKAYSHAGNWNIYDTARQPNNPAEYLLLANEANQQNNPAGQSIDILSNGFKCRGANAAINESYSYIYFAWAEHPFGGENAAPATAR